MLTCCAYLPVFVAFICAFFCTLIDSQMRRVVFRLAEPDARKNGLFFQAARIHTPE